MANMKCNGSGDLQTPASIVCEFQRNLREERDQHQSQRNAYVVLIERAKMARGYKLCTLAETDETWNFYHDLDNYELFDFQSSAVIIQSHIDGYVKKDDDLGTLIKDGSKLLNDLKTKLMDANNASCTMRNCLQSVLGEDCLPDQLKAVTEIARELSENGQHAAEAMIDIAGIHTFANLNSLKTLAADLVTLVKDFKACTDGYIKQADDAIVKAQTDLTTVIKDLNEEEFQSFEETSLLNSTNSTIEFICEGECPPIECVEEICRETSTDSEKGGGQARKPKWTTGDED
jgi:hypothetical protein